VARGLIGGPPEWAAGEPLAAAAVCVHVYAARNRKRRKHRHTAEARKNVFRIRELELPVKGGQKGWQCAGDEEYAPMVGGGGEGVEPRASDIFIRA